MDAGGVELGYNNRVMFQDTATTLLNTSQSFIDQNPNTVKAFSDAMIESIEAASEDPDDSEAALGPASGSPPSRPPERAGTSTAFPM